MTTIHRRVHTSSAPDAVFNYLADFTNAAEWDAGTVSCIRLSGDGGEGTVYRNVSSFMGRKVTLEYTVTQFAPPVFVIVGKSGNTTSTDRIEVIPDGDGSIVDYLAEFQFSGLTRLIGPLLRPALSNLGNRTERTLHAALEQL